MSGKKMKKLVVPEPYRMEIEECEIPRPAYGKTLLKVEYAGVCGSDLGLYEGRMSGYATYPRVPGHEVAARVVETHGPSNGLSQGELVTVNPYFNCGICYSCRRGLVNCCTNNQTMGLPIDGVFAQYFTIPTERVYSAEGLDPIQTSMIEPFCIGYHAARLAGPKPGERALVIGAGTIGVFTMMALRLMGMETVVANRNGGRLAKAKAMGASAVWRYGSAEELVEKSMAYTGGDGFDVTVDAVGNPAVFEIAVETACHRGRLVEVGITPESASLPLSLLQKKELQIFGSRNALKEDFLGLIRLLGESRIDITGMVSSITRFEDSPALFAHASKDKTALKRILDFTE